MKSRTQFDLFKIALVTIIHKNNITAINDWCSHATFLQIINNAERLIFVTFISNNNPKNNAKCILKFLQNVIYLLNYV